MGIYTPTTRNINSALDSLGGMLSLIRNPGESLASFKRKILDYGFHKPGSDYKGLINAISRDLGLEHYEAIQFIPSNSLTSPKIEITAGFVKLYDEFNSDTSFSLIAELDIRTGPFSYMQKLVDEINVNVDNFTASMLVTSATPIYSAELLAQDSDIEVTETVLHKSKFKLENPNIKVGSLIFSEINKFKTETTSDLVLNDDGNYFVDYDNGIIDVNALPSGRGTVTYQYRDFPFKAKANPIVISSLFDPEMEQSLFFREPVKRFNDLGQNNINVAPKPEMIDLIRELLEVHKQGWGN